MRPSARLLIVLLSCGGMGVMPLARTGEAVPASSHLARSAPSPWTTFNPPPRLASPVSLWATFYHVYHAASLAQGYPLLGPGGDRLGPRLSQRDWCKAALQGTVQITNAGQSATYNFSGRGEASQVDCAPFFTRLSQATLQKVERVRFTAATAPYGYGTQGLNLVPYRTIAVDRTQIPVGSVVFIPAARGVPVTLPSGDRVIHDGYFFAGDVGSAIHGNHIDVFTGISDRSPFDFIQSQSSGKFQAYIVRDPAIAQALLALHR